MMNFEDLFIANDYSCGVDDELDNYEIDINFSYGMLSPPISVPSSPIKYGQMLAYYDSNLRENDFLRRMQQSSNNEIKSLSSNDFTIIPASVKTTAKTVSNVKVKLESIQIASKIDQNILKRSNSRRSVKFRRLQQIGFTNESNQIFIEDQQIDDNLFEPPIVW